MAPTFLFAQNEAGVKHLEEVKKKLAVSAADTNRVLLIIDLCTAYQWTDIDSFEYYSKKGIELAQRLNFVRGEVRILNNQGIAFLFRGDIPKALNILYQALRLAEKNGYRLETAISLNNIGAGLKIRPVDLFDNVWSGDHQILIAALIDFAAEIHGG